MHWVYGFQYALLQQVHGRLEQLMQCLTVLRWLHCPHGVGVCLGIQMHRSQGYIWYRNALVTRLRDALVARLHAM